jgi:nitrate reductase gamma subunit
MALFDDPLVNELLFGVYPYIGMTLFFLGSLVRFDCAQYSWKSDSSQLLRRRELMWGSNLFHAGILFLFLGHLFGLLVPHQIYTALGLSIPAKQMLAIVSGGLAGLLTLAGIALLIHRRITEPRVRATSSGMDYVVLFWILAVLLLGLSSIAISLQHRDGTMMLRLAAWAQHIWTFRTDAADFLLGVPALYKIHLLLGMTLFVLIPFSRLVHIWSGFAALAYVGRNYQVVRPRGKAGRIPGYRPE